MDCVQLLVMVKRSYGDSRDCSYLYRNNIGVVLFKTYSLRKRLLTRSITKISVMFKQNMLSYFIIALMQVLNYVRYIMFNNI